MTSSGARLRRPGRLGRVLVAVAIATVVVLGGFALAEYVANDLGGTTLVIYTYPSLFNGTDCNVPYAGTVFAPFESAHHVHIEVECPAGTLVNTLLAQANAPTADLVIGLDEITAPEAEADHLLVPYAPPALADVPPALDAELSPDDGAVPYEWGYLAIDYASAFAAATDGAVAHATFPEIAANASWSRQLVVEDPSLDITGEEFLAWEVEYYTHVLHENWTEFWSAVKGSLPPPAPDWGTAFGEFMDAPGQNQMVVSYSTDPAYAAYYGEGGSFNSTVAWWNGTAYGWRTVYGIGIVSGTRHLTLDEQFENWFLSGAVQTVIPTTEWEYPANTTVPLPAVFAAALDPSGIVPLNDETTPAALAASLPGWVETWLDLFS